MSLSKTGLRLVRPNVGYKEEYMISLFGCDDSTHFTMVLAPEEAKLLEKVSELSKKTSTYCCMPSLYIDKYMSEDEDDD